MLGRIATLVGSIAVAASTQAGVVVHVAAKNLHDGKQTPRTVYYAQDGLLRVDSLNGDGRVNGISLIRDGAIWEIDVAQRTYRKIDKAAVENQMGALDARMQAMLAQMPPERRAMMEQRFKQMQTQMSAGAGPDFNDTGRSDRSGPYTCRLWDLKHNDKIIEEYCVASTGSLPGGDEIAASMRQASAIAKDVLSGNSPMAKAMAKRFAAFTKMNGFPVLTREFDGGKPSREEVVTNIERGRLAADKFAIPKGFKPASGTNSD